MTLSPTPDTITLRDGYDARLLLSYGRLSRSIPRSIQVLEVGCSTGEDLIQQAKLQPDVHFMGVDGCESAIGSATQRAKEEGLSNVSFEVVELTDLDSITAPEGGFDLAYVGQPPAGEDLGAYLALVQAHLAPHGLTSVRLPGHAGHKARVAAAIDGLAPRSKPLRERLEVARDHVDRMVTEEPQNTDWRRAALVDDTELVVRYMGGSPANCDVAGVFAAIESAGLSFVRWHDAAAWNFESLELEREELVHLRGVSAVEQFAAVEQHLDPDVLSFVVCGPGNGARERFDLTKAGETHFMVHPEVTFTIDSRNNWGSTQYEGLKVRRGNEEPVAVRPSPALTALFTLRNQREPFSGLNLVETMTAEGANLEEALMALHQLIGLELVYQPQEFDVAQFYQAILRARAEDETGTRAAEIGEGLVVTPSVPREIDELPQPLPKQATEQPAPELSPELSIEPSLETDA